jgi:hypothetical protein
MASASREGSASLLWFQGCGWSRGLPGWRDVSLTPAALAELG